MKVTTIWRNYRSRGYKSIIIAIALWVVMCAGVFFLSPLSLGYYDYVAEMTSRTNIIITVIHAIFLLALMVYPMWEYLMRFHRPRGTFDRYKWYIPFIVSIASFVIVVFILDAASGTMGWVTLVEFVGLCLVAVLPRFIFPAQ